MVDQQNSDIADTLHLRDVAVATIFWLSIGLYVVHIGATWQIRLNRPCAAVMRLMSNYFDDLFCLKYIMKSIYLQGEHGRLPPF